MSGLRPIALACPLLALLLPGGSCNRAGNRLALPVLTTCDQVRRLPPSEAHRGYPVRLHGTVTFYDTKYHILTMQDESGGVLIDSRDLELDNVVPGVRLDVEGYSGHEEYDAVVVKPRIHVGPLTLFPAARKVAASRVLEGREDFQYVAVPARFMSVSLIDNVHLRMILESHGRSLEAIVSTDEPMPDWPAGTAILVRGVASVFYDAQGNPHSARLHVFRLADVELAGQLPTAASPARGPGPGLPVLTKAEQIKRLSAAQAAEGYPVRLQGVLNLFSTPSRTVFLQDPTGGVLVSLDDAPPPILVLGTQIEVEGVTYPGDFAPGIHQAQMRVLAPGHRFPPVEIPEPSAVALRDENKWARARGIARRVKTLADSGIQLDLDVNGGHLPVDIPDAPPPEECAQWIDAELQIEGVVGPLFDQNRLLLGFHLIAPSEKFVTVTRRAPAEPFAAPAVPLASLLQYRADDPPRHRIKVAGTVSAVRLDGTMHITAGGASLRLLTNVPPSAHVGDSVEALGFLPLGVKQPVLEAADIRVTGRGVTDPPADSTGEDLMTGALDSRLVRLDAHLISQQASYGDEVLELRAGKTVFHAVLEQPQPFGELTALRPGSMLRLTGVCDVTWDVTRVPAEPLSFRLLLRSPADIAVVQLASWWTARNTLTVLVNMCVLVIAILGWVFVLQRRVNRQTAMIAARLERETQLQAQLSQSQRLESVGRLAGGVAHDFNNLLTVINGYSDLALARLSRADPLRASVEQIRRAGERAAALTQQLLGFSRKQIIQPKPVDLNSIIAETCSLLKPLVGELIEIRTVLAPGLGAVVGDSGQVEQILMNLAANARDAMPRGGTLTIETRNVEVAANDAGRFTDIPPGQYVMLSLTDTGSGMTEVTRQKVFEPFFTTKAAGSGTGLGLATVYGIVKQNGGWIDVESELGKGSAFHIWLPRTDEVAASRAAAVPQTAAHGSERLLLVEDEADVRQYATQVLKAHGYAVLSAPDAESALALLEDQTGPIDLLVTDVVLPHMNGRDLAQRLKADRPAMQVLFTSGYAQDVIAEHGVLDPGVAYIAKPYTPEELNAKVREILAGPPDGAA